MQSILILSALRLRKKKQIKFKFLGPIAVVNRSRKISQ